MFLPPGFPCYELPKLDILMTFEFSTSTLLLLLILITSFSIVPGFYSRSTLLYLNPFLCPDYEACYLDSTACLSFHGFHPSSSLCLLPGPILPKYFHGAKCVSAFVIILDFLDKTDLTYR